MLSSKDVAVVEEFSQEEVLVIFSFSCSFLHYQLNTAENALYSYCFTSKKYMHVHSRLVACTSFQDYACSIPSAKGSCWHHAEPRQCLYFVHQF